MTAPLFSIVVATHDRAPLLRRCLASLLPQEPPDFEIVVVDDGSTDDTRAVVEGMGDGRIRYIHQDNAGVNRARNRGAALSRGRYFVFMDDDDEVLPAWLARMAAAAAGAPGAVCCGQLHLRGRKVVRTKMPIDMGAQSEHVKGRFNPGTYALRRDVFEAVGGFREDLPAGEHSELALRITVEAGRRGWSVECVDEPLVLHHLHAGPRLSRNPGAMRKGAERFLELHGSRLLRLNPRRYANYKSVIALNAAREGDLAGGGRAFLEALRVHPTRWRHCARFAYLVLKSAARRLRIPGSAGHGTA